MFSEKWYLILKDLLPDGDLFELFPGFDHDDIFRALSYELGRLDAFIVSVRDEGNPEKVSQLLEEWINIFNIDPGLTDEEKVNTIVSLYSAIGNQALNYIQTQLNKLGFGAIAMEFIEDDSDHCGPAICGVAQCGLGMPALRVFGTFTSAQLRQIKSIMEYYKPGHVDVIYIDSLTFTPAVCNIGRVGASRTGVNQ